MGEVFLRVRYKMLTYSLDLDNSSTVDDVKRMIAGIRGCDVNDIALIYNGDILLGNKSLSSYGIHSVSARAQEPQELKMALNGEDINSPELTTAYSSPPDLPTNMKSNDAA